MNALTFKTPGSLFADYTSRFSTVLKDFDWSPVEKLAYDLRDCWQTGRQVFFCGNGGSGGISASSISRSMRKFPPGI